MYSGYRKSNPTMISLNTFHSAKNWLVCKQNLNLKNLICISYLKVLIDGMESALKEFIKNSLKTLQMWVFQKIIMHVANKELKRICKVNAHWQLLICNTRREKKILKNSRTVSRRYDKPNVTIVWDIECNAKNLFTVNWPVIKP